MCYKCEFFAFCMNANLNISCLEIKKNIEKFPAEVNSMKSYLMANHVSVEQAKKIMREPQIVACQTETYSEQEDEMILRMGDREKACQWCGKRFLPVAKESKYCSVGCYREAQKRSKNVFERTCEACGKTFETTAYYTRFCSQECRSNVRKNREERVCLQCGKKFSVIKSKQQKFCSKECYRKYKQPEFNVGCKFIGKISSLLCKL